MTTGRAPSLLGLFAIEEQGTDSFVAPTTSSWGPRMFGGLVAGQSMAAACRTVAPEHKPQSMHAYFILPGDPRQPLVLDVERTRDGRSFTTRRVVASQAGAAIFEMSASFHRDEEGGDWSTPVPVEAADPETLAPLVTTDDRPSSGYFDMRPLNPTSGPFTPPPYWVRATEDTPDDPGLQACILAYLSDMGILAMARAPGEGPIGSATSLDHAIWFHRPYHPADWHLFTGAPRSSRGGRGLAVGGLHHRDGSLVATIVQEGLFRASR